MKLFNHLVVVCLSSLINTYANPYPLGDGRSYLGLGYSVHEYDRFLAGKNVITGPFASGLKIKESAYALTYEHGLNKRDTFIFNSKYSDVEGNGLPQAIAPGNSFTGISDTYIGWKRNIKADWSASAFEIGVLISDDYEAKSLVAPGKGTSGLALSYYWTTSLSERSILGSTFRYAYHNNKVPNNFLMHIELYHQINQEWSLRFFGSQLITMGGPTIGQPSTGWVGPASFHVVDEERQILGFGVIHEVNEDWSLSATLSGKIAGKNTDNSHTTLTIGVGYSF